ncbi:MAG: dockerin type I domain-containing protein [Ruminococcus sp.]
MKKIKALSVALAVVIGLSCLGINAFAEVGAPEDYESLAANVDSDLISEWEAAALRSLEIDGITANDHTITFSDPYCVYNFYDMALDSGKTRLVYVDGELYGYSSADIEDWQEYGFVSAPVYEFNHEIITEKLSDAIANGKTVLFGRAFINGLPNNLIYIDGEIYSPNSTIYTDGTTDLEFGNIPYSEFAGGVEDADEICPGTAIISGNSTFAYTLGDVDMDGVITGHDAAIVSRYLLEEDYTLTETQLLLADINGDDKVTQYDADLIITKESTPEIGKVVWNNGIEYRNLSDVRAIIDCYVSNAVEKEISDYSTPQINNCDMNADGVINFDDIKINLKLFALRAAGLKIENEQNKIYYYSADPSSPAYIES